MAVWARWPGCGPRAPEWQGHWLPLVADNPSPHYHAGEPVDRVVMVHAASVLPPHGGDLVGVREDSPLHLHCISVNTGNK